VTRRTMLGIVALGGGGLVAWRHWPSASVVEAGSPAVSSEPKVVTIVDFSDAGLRQATKEIPKLVKTEAEWRRQLSPISFEVTRHAATERPFTGATWNLHDSGIYRCVCCDTALFSSETKFESGTGWPSFWTPLDKKNIVEESDRTFGMVRTAVSCRRCDAHLGHVFDDGPRPTGLRYCMNSAAMRFARARQEKAS
jgi:peptide-methionine (R)-S-oxide reductase